MQHPDPFVSTYYDPQKVTAAVQSGAHRAWVGGMWDEIGRLQFQFLEARGLMPGHRVLDVGCGCFRAGIHLVEFLDAGCYYGVDLSQALLDAGYEKELVPRGLDRKLPRDNLLCDADFRADRFGVAFDVAIAQSVFTHLPFNHLRQCLTRLAVCFKPGGVFYATVFLGLPGAALAEPLLHDPGGITTYPTQNPYHCTEDDLHYAARGLPWSVTVIGDWGHPRNQRMVCFERSA